ncbi:hypothetical protein EV132_12281 [Rhizobium sullae]|uniref:Uncharacterized protein n=1 Tax=Rhizobium sullae TaxID=50338 RepID=A0A4R3PT65_RHISU|nr:hypothetical protein EV132_12281 [Rhizobium sullae]
MAGTDQADPTQRAAVAEMEAPADVGAVVHHKSVFHLEAVHAVGRHRLPEREVDIIAFVTRAGLRQFLDLQLQHDWMEGKTTLRGADERLESLELRFKYIARFERLLRRPQAPEVLEILRRYGRDCIPIPRRTDRYYWSASCLPSTPGKALVRINASWMELFSLYADGEDIRALFVVHLSDFTTDRSRHHGRVDEAFLERRVVTPEDVSYFFPRGKDMFKVRGFSSISKFLTPRRVLQAIRAFNLTHMNRGRLSGEPLLQPGGSHAER